MDEMNTIESLANAIKEIIEYQKHLANEITEIKTAIMDDLINPIKDEYEKMEYDNALSDWRCKYAEKLEGFDGKLKALEGEDFDIMKKSFDDFNERQLEGCFGYNTCANIRTFVSHHKGTCKGKDCNIT